MKIRNLYILVTVIYILIVSSCSVQNQAPVASVSGVVETSIDLNIDEVTDNIRTVKQSGKPVLLITPTGQVQGIWSFGLQPGVTANGRYQMNVQSGEEVMIELKGQECDSSSEEGKRSSTLITSLAEVSELWDLSPKPGDSMTGHFEMELLPSGEVMIRLGNEECN